MENITFRKILDFFLPKIFFSASSAVAAADENPEFELRLAEKTYTWTAVNFEEKKRFLSTLVSVVTRSGH